MPYLHSLKFLIMELNFTHCTTLHKYNELLCLQQNCDNHQRTRFEESVAYSINLNEPVQLSWFALPTHQHEIPKSLNETQ